MFVNPLMLAGLAGAVVPLFLHLLNRARYREVAWSAMMFLPGAADHRQRRAVRLRQVVLLTTRMAAVALLAVALARPVIGARRASSIGSGGHTRLVLLLDCSASMGYTANGRARFDAARRAALSVLQDLHSGDEAAVLLVGIDDGPGRDGANLPVALTTDLRSVTDRVADASVAAARSDVAVALTAALQTLGAPTDSIGSAQQVVLITDRQASSWTNVDEAFALLFRKAEASLVIVPVGGDESDNLAIESLALPPPRSPLIRDVPDELDVTVHNFGPVARASVPIVVTSGGREYGRQNVSLVSGASAVVHVPVRFATAGPHVLTARIAPTASAASSAGLAADDRLDFAFDVADPIRVLVLDGQRPPSTDEVNLEMSGAADVIRAALMPYSTAGEQNGPDPAHVEIVGVAGSAPWPVIDRHRCDVAVLCGIARADPRQVDRLAQFIFDGGGLVIVPERAALDESPGAWTATNGTRLLPARLRRLPSSSFEPDARLEHFAAADLSHPALAFLGGRGEALSRVQFARRFLTEPSPDAAILINASSSNGPILLDRPLGRGHIVLFNALLTPGLANPLPRSNLLLPLMQSLTRWIAKAPADATAPRNLLPGEPIEASVPDATGERATIVLPDGSREPIELTRRSIPSAASGEQPPAVFRFTRTRAVGRYEVRYRSTAPGGPERTVHFIVRLPPEESDLTPLTSARWTALSERLGFTRLSPAELEAGRRGTLTYERQSRSGGAVELWAALIGAVGTMLLLEGWLSRRWSAAAAAA